MPFSDDFSLIFNCGFCRTLFWSVPFIRVTMERNGQQKKEWENVVRSDHDLSVLFQSRFNGPRFTVRCNYFCKHSKQRSSLFDCHCQRLYTAWRKPFRSWQKGYVKEDYVSTFSSVSWDSLSKHEKSSHSISKCFGCAKMYGDLQKSFR